MVPPPGLDAGREEVESERRVDGDVFFRNGQREREWLRRASMMAVAELRSTKPDKMVYAAPWKTDMKKKGKKRERGAKDRQRESPSVIYKSEDVGVFDAAEKKVEGK